eukprot:543565-Lingulodinium_polyedra.AAC.1
MVRTRVRVKSRVRAARVWARSCVRPTRFREMRVRETRVRERRAFGLQQSRRSRVRERSSAFGAIFAFSGAFGMRVLAFFSGPVYGHVYAQSM